MPRADILPPQPQFIATNIALTDLRIDCPCCGQSVAGICRRNLSLLGRTSR
jgi:hypothetical protein